MVMPELFEHIVAFAMHEIKLKLLLYDILMNVLNNEDFLPILNVWTIF